MSNSIVFMEMETSKESRDPIYTAREQQEQNVIDGGLSKWRLVNK